MTFLPELNIKNTNSLVLKGNDNVFILREKENIYFDYKGFTSNKFDVDSLVGTVNNFSISTKDKVFNFVLKSELSHIHKDLDIFSNVITICSQFKIINKSNFQLFIGLQEDLDFASNLPSNETTYSFYLWGKSLNKKVCFNTELEPYGWSGGICLTDCGIHLDRKSVV